MSASDIRHVFTMGCPRKKIHTLPPPPRQKGFWKFLQEGGGEGVKDPGNPDRRGVKLEKVFCRGHFDHG